MRRWSETATPKGETRSRLLGVLTMASKKRSGLLAVRQNCTPRASSATPAVATSSVTRGASNSGRITRRSVSSPMPTADARPTINPIP